MKVGDLVRPKKEYHSYVPQNKAGETTEPFTGIVIDSWQGDPIVYWNEKFHSEVEYIHQLEVLRCLS